MWVNGRWIAPTFAPADEGAAGAAAAGDTIVAGDTQAGAAAADENLLGASTVAAADTTAGADTVKPAPAEENLLDGELNDDGEADKSEAPKEYTFTTPEGFEALDADLIADFTPIAKELGLSNEKAQKLVDHFATSASVKMAEKQAGQWSQLKSNWAAEFKADPEYGGANLKASLGLVAKGADFLGPEFRATINLLGGGNHPAILRGLAKLGKAQAEDTQASSGAPASRALTTAEILYPNEKSRA